MLYTTHFGVFTATAKQSRRLETKVANFFLVPIPQTETILLGDFGVLFFFFVLFLFCTGFAFFAFFFNVLENGSEITLDNIFGKTVYIGK